MNYGYVMTLIKAICVMQTTNDLRPLNAIPLTQRCIMRLFVCTDVPNNPYIQPICILMQFGSG